MVQRDFRNGTRFVYKDIRFVVIGQIDAFHIQARDVERGETAVLNKTDLLSEMEDGAFQFEGAGRLLAERKTMPVDFQDLPKDVREEAKRRYEILKPLLPKCPKEKVRLAAKNADVNISTLYRWIAGFKQYRLEGILPWHSEKGPREYRLHPRSEEILQSLAERRWRDPRKITIAQIHQELEEECSKEGVPIPSYPTVQRRIDAIKKQFFMDREGVKAYEKKFLPVPNSFHATRSLHYIQIDHKKLDLIVVDPVNGERLGKPWLTVGIDLYSRAPWGFCIGMDDPSYQSVAMCLFNGISLKNELCKKHNISKAWEIYGIPETVHVDNGMEFHSGAFEEACCQLGIQIHYRKARKPRFGAVIERFFGTIDKKVISLLPGKTFSNPIERGEYKSEKEARVTLAELETVICKFFDLYMNQCHGSTKMPPIIKWAEGLVLHPFQVLESPDLLKLMLMKSDERIVGRTGIHFEKIQYWDESLHDRIGETITFRYSPANLTYIFVPDGEKKKFNKISAKPEFRQRASLSEWEVRAVNAFENKRGVSLESENIGLKRLDYRDTLNKILSKRKRVRSTILRHDEERRNFLIPSSAKEEPTIQEKGTSLRNGKNEYVPPFEVEIG